MEMILNKVMTFLSKDKDLDEDEAEVVSFTDPLATLTRSSRTIPRDLTKFHRSTIKFGVLRYILN